MLAHVLDLLFPKTCASCGREGSFVCEDCLSLIPLACAPSPLPARSSLAGLFCAASYEDVLVKRLVRLFKYPPCNRNLGKPLAFLIVSHFELLNNRISPPDALCSVPLRKRRLKWRGFNHAEELASQLATAWEVPVASGVLSRIKHAPPQAKLNRETRLKNIDGVFAATPTPSLKGKTIFLVDDVYTTGATMQECARLLRKAGAEQVFGVALARD